MCNGRFYCTHPPFIDTYGHFYTDGGISCINDQNQSIETNIQKIMVPFDLKHL